MRAITATCITVACFATVGFVLGTWIGFAFGAALHQVWIPCP
jgi:hypothetical protein